MNVATRLPTQEGPQAVSAKPMESQRLQPLSEMLQPQHLVPGRSSEWQKMTLNQPYGPKVGTAWTNPIQLVKNALTTHAIKE